MSGEKNTKWNGTAWTVAAAGDIWCLIGGDVSDISRNSVDSCDDSPHRQTGWNYTAKSGDH